MGLLLPGAVRSVSFLLESPLPLPSCFCVCIAALHVMCSTVLLVADAWSFVSFSFVAVNVVIFGLRHCVLVSFSPCTPLLPPPRLPCL